LELEADERRDRRVTRLRPASKFPPGKTFDTLDEGRLPAALVRKLHELGEGIFWPTRPMCSPLESPGWGKVTPSVRSATHSSTAATRCSSPQPTAWCRNCSPPNGRSPYRAPCARLDHFEVLLLDDLGYIQQSPEEAEVLFTLLAERYERRSILLTSNLVFGQWERIFRDQMATAAALDRLVHHAVLLELDVASYRRRQ
jgi:hypothetical protein